MTIMRNFRKILPISMALFAMGLVAGHAQEKFPSKPITLIVPWSAGGGSDTSMRLVAEAAEKYMGQPVVVVNKPGAGGAEGTRAIASAEPDGYTIGMIGIGLIARHYGNPNANDFHDLQPIAFFGAEPAAVTARTETGFSNLKDFVDAAKAKPRGVKNGNDQPGGASHIAASVIESSLGIKLTKVPYGGYAPTVTALLSGEVDTATVPVPDVVEHHKAGKLKILGVADAQRHFLAPDVPTFKEQGYDLEIGAWRMIMAPKGIPADRLAIIEKAILETLKDPEFVKRANAAGFVVSPKGIDGATADLEQSDKLLYPILKDAGLVKTRAHD